MCGFCQHCDNSPEWLRSAQSLAWKHRAVVVPIACVVLVLAAVTGLLVYLFTPTDIERAEADLKKSWAVINRLEDEARDEEKGAHRYSRCAIDYRKSAEEDKDSADPVCLDWYEASAASSKQLAKAKWERRNTLIHLTACYRRLIAEAECEIIRAKDARDRGTPYKVAPRVRDILAPILSDR